MLQKWSGVQYDPSPDCVALTRYFYTQQERPDEQLRLQLLRAERRVYRVVQQHDLETHQLDALICLVSDIEAGLAASPSATFEKSFLVTALNHRMFQIAAAEFLSFCYADGKVQTRVWQKRKAEQYLFSRGHLLFE